MSEPSKEALDDARSWISTWALEEEVRDDTLGRLLDTFARRAVEGEESRCSEIAEGHECGGEDDFICQGQNCGSIIAAAIRARSAQDQP